MSSFSFDSSLSADENVDRFFDHLKVTQPDFADLLRTNIGTMLPFPENTQDRLARRAAFNKDIIASLEPVAESCDSEVDAR